MNLIIREFPDLVADRLKFVTGSSTLSKAVLKVTSDYFEVLDENSKNKALLEQQRAEIQRLERLIEGARSAAGQLLERTSQTELRV